MTSSPPEQRSAPERIGKRHARPSPYIPPSAAPAAVRNPARTAPTLERLVEEDRDDDQPPLEESLRERPKLRVPKL